MPCIVIEKVSEDSGEEVTLRKVKDIQKMIRVVEKEYRGHYIKLLYYCIEKHLTFQEKTFL